jgi:hypothetical protein
VLLSDNHQLRNQSLHGDSMTVDENRMPRAVLAIEGAAAAPAIMRQIRYRTKNILKRRVSVKE